MKGSGSSSDNPTQTKCLSGLLRSLLCTGSLPTHPADHLNIEPNTEAEHVIKQASATANPGVVARLMGLESLPASPLPARQKTLGSYLRSRSVNSIDFLSQFDPACHRRHRRVKTSVSFREVPSVFSQFNVVFPLEEVDETVYAEKGKTVRRIRGKSRNGEKFEDGTVRRKVSGRKMETGDEGRTVGGKFRKRDFSGRASVNSKERRALINKPVTDCGERRPSMKQVKKKKVHGVFKKIHPEPMGRELHETSSKKRDSSQKHTSSKCQLTKNGEIRAIKTDKRSRNECTDMLEEVFKLTRESVNSDWTYGQILNLEDFEDMCAQFGGQILQFLLTQIVEELVLL